MREINTVMLLFFFAIMIFSCSQEKAEGKVEVRDGVEVRYLFDIDGCKVHRFEDMGRYIYVTTCPNSETQYSYTSGKVTGRIHSKTVGIPEDAEKRIKELLDSVNHLINEKNNNTR